MTDQVDPIVAARQHYEAAVRETATATTSLEAGIVGLMALAEGLANLPTTAPGVASFCRSLATTLDREADALAGVLARGALAPPSGPTG